MHRLATVHGGDLNLATASACWQVASVSQRLDDGDQCRLRKRSTGELRGSHCLLPLQVAHEQIELPILASHCSSSAETDHRLPRLSTCHSKPSVTVVYKSLFKFLFTSLALQVANGKCDPLD